MNKVILMGRLTRNPDVRYGVGEGASAVARYTLAVDRRYKKDGGPEADFIGCVAFGRQAEFAEKYLKQGTKIAITGRIQTGSYTNREGVKVYTTDIVVEEQEFAESKAASANHSANAGNGYGYPNNNSYGSNTAQSSMPVNNGNTQTSQPVGDGFMTIPEGIEDELPFI